MFSLTDQVRRSSRSVGANIAEAWRKRRYEAHFVSKMSDADAECSETLHWLHVAESSRYLSHDEHDQLGRECAQIGAMIGQMIQNAAKWYKLR